MDDITTFVSFSDMRYVGDYLRSIANQTYDKNRLHLFIDVSQLDEDGRVPIDQFLSLHRPNYGNVLVYSSSIEHAHQDALNYARHNQTDYFVADQNVILHPRTLKRLHDLNLEVVAPMLTYDGVYSNFHAYVDVNGYYQGGEQYWRILRREVKGIHQVPVVNACYFIRHDQLKYVRYKDGTGRLEYVVFSDYLRQNLVQQYIDNRLNYGIFVNYDGKDARELRDSAPSNNKDFFLNVGKTTKKGVLCNSDWLSTYICVEHFYLTKGLQDSYGFDIINCNHLDFENAQAINDLNSYDVLLVMYHWYRKLPLHLLSCYKIYKMDDLLNNPVYDEIAKHHIRHADTVISPYAYVFDKYHEHNDVLLVPYSSAVETCVDYGNMGFNDDPKVKVLASGNLHETAPFRRYVASLDNPNVERIVHPGYYQPNDPSSEALVRDRYFWNLREYLCCFTDALTLHYILLKCFEIPSVGALLLADKAVEKEMNELGFIDYQTCIFCDQSTFETTVEWIIDPRNRREVDNIRRAGMTLAREKHLTRHRAGQINELAIRRAYHNGPSRE